MQALLLIDLQNDYFPGGAMELSASEDAVYNAARVLAYFRAKNLPVFHVRHLANRPGATFFLPNTPGSYIHQTVAPIYGEMIVEKHYPNSFRDTKLLERLRAASIDSLTVCGMMTHMCVDTTVRAAFDLGFSVTLVHDACATRDLAFNGSTVPAAQVQTAFISALNGLFAKVIDTDSIIG
jgi:nicotinamidase-related amidase